MSPHTPILFLRIRQNYYNFVKTRKREEIYLVNQESEGVTVGSYDKTKTKIQTFQKTKNQTKQKKG